MLDVLAKAKEHKAARDAGAPSSDAVTAAKRAAIAARIPEIAGAIEPLGGHYVKYQNGFASLEVQRGYGEVILSFVPCEPFKAVDGKTRWRKGKFAKTLWTFTPEGERGCEVVWENGLQHFMEVDAVLEEVAKRIGAILCQPPWEELEA